MTLFQYHLSQNNTSRIDSLSTLEVQNNPLFYMKNKLFVFTLVSSSLLVGSNSAIADWDYWGIFKTDPNLSDTGLEFYTVNSQTGESTLRSTLCLMDIVTNKCRVEIGENTHEDPETGELFFEDYQNQIRTYNLENDKWTTTGSSSWRRPLPHKAIYTKDVQ